MLCCLSSLDCVNKIDAQYHYNVLDFPVTNEKHADNTRKGWCPRIGKGQWFMGKEAVNGNISSYWVWKRAKIISPNNNPPSKARGL